MNLSRRAAFTLVEIMIVVVIIGVLAAMSISAFKRITVKSQATTVVNNLRQFAAAFEQYATAKGEWPPDALGQIIPAGMEDYMSNRNWMDALPGGYVYDWDYDANGELVGYIAGISIAVSEENSKTSMFVEIDKMIDDGNTTTGRFRFMHGDRMSYILQEKP